MAKNKAGLLFVFSPVLGLVAALRNLKNKQSLLVLFGFCLCFGICFSVGLDRYEGSSDGISMRIEFDSSKHLTSGQFAQYISEYFEYDTGAQDIYIVTVSYLVGKITDNYHIFFLVLAFVFAFFQIKCLKYFVREDNFTNSFICLLLAFLFLWNNIYNINGARYWTAAWIGLYCVFKVFYDNKPIYILFSTLTLLVHASFVVFPIILLIGYLTIRYHNIWLLLFCISWVFSLIAEDFQIHIFDNIELPFLIEKKVEVYTDRSRIVQGSGFYWVQRLFESLVKNYIELLILLVAISWKKLNNKRLAAIVSMMVILATLSNFGMVIPTFGGRLFKINYALVAYSFLVTFGDKKYNKLIYVMPFLWFMNIYYLVTDIIDVLDIGFVLSPIISFIRYTIFY